MLLKTHRLAEIDLLRGIAILLMIIFHTIFDLAYFYQWPIDYLDGFWYYQGKTSAILFMLVSGISCTLSHNSLRRGLQVLGIGLMITATTYVFSPTMYIQFGILHLLGIGMITSSYWKRYNSLALAIAGTVCIAIGQAAANLKITTPWLIPFGLTPPGFASFDYYPLFPWLGVILYGMAAGKFLYSTKRAVWPTAIYYRPIRCLNWLGQHSLVIYLIHQPLILTGLYAVHKVMS